MNCVKMLNVAVQGVHLRNFVLNKVSTYDTSMVEAVSTFNFGFVVLKRQVMHIDQIIVKNII